MTPQLHTSALRPSYFSPCQRQNPNESPTDYTEELRQLINAHLKRIQTYIMSNVTLSQSQTSSQ